MELKLVKGTMVRLGNGELASVDEDRGREVVVMTQGGQRLYTARSELMTYREFNDRLQARLAR